MYEGHTVGVVVPAYNEAGFVGEVLESLPGIVDRAYVVDDCSTDGTWTEIVHAAERINELAAADETARSTVAPERVDAASAREGQITHHEEAAPLEEAAHLEEGTHIEEAATQFEELTPLDITASIEADESDGESTPATRSPDSPAGSDESTPAERALDTDGGVNVEHGGVGVERRIVPIRHETNRGVGGAITTGYARALADGLDVVAVINGDGQMDPTILDRILDPVVAGRADYAKGNRLGRPDHRAAMPPFRRFGNHLLTVLTKCVTGNWSVEDPQNGYTAISREALETIDLDRLYDGFGFCNDLLVHLEVHGFRTEDVPMSARYGDERSHIRFSQFVPTVSWLLARRAYWRVTSQYVRGGLHPIAVALFAGLFTIGAGVGALGWSVLSSGTAPTGVLSAIGLLAAGCLFVLLAIAGDRATNVAPSRGTPGHVGGERS